jgi:hypothetical protein
MRPLDARRLAEVLCTVTNEASLLVMRVSEAGSLEGPHPDDAHLDRAALRRLRASASMLGPMQPLVPSLGDFLARLDELRAALTERERAQVRVAAERLLATPIG